MSNYKKSDPIINYPELELCSIEMIEQWLSDKKTDGDTFAILWYKNYLDRMFNHYRDMHDIDMCHKIDICISYIRCYCL